MLLKFFVIFNLFIFSPLNVWAQEGDEEHLGTEELHGREFLEKVKKLRPTRFTDLIHLSPFSDVSVIQRRFMPKTGRMAFSLTSNFVLSSEFLLHPGAEAHLSYHFLEKHGLELTAYHIFTFNRGITDDLEPVGIEVIEETTIIQSFVGLAYKWMPVYGKMAFFNERILAFDTFFNIGGGMGAVANKSKRRAQMIWEPTFTAGIGQVFAITRNLGMRWDLRWYMTFQTQRARNTFTPFTLSNFILSVGLSYYYPSAGSR